MTVTFYRTLKTNFVRDDTWQHCCITWDRLDVVTVGKVSFYKNGVFQEFKEKLSEKDPISSGGKLIIGQRQGSYGSNFDDKKLMVGYMNGLNIWSRVFTPVEVQNLASKCQKSPGGDIVSWSDVQSEKLEGNVQKICPSSCP